MSGLNIPVPPLHVALPAPPPITPARVTSGDVAQTTWSIPAFAIAAGLTVITTSEVETVHGGLLIVHRSVYVPAPPAGVKIAAGFESPPVN